MGKIMMNGIQYGVGGIEQAKDISYDNTESGATATDVQGALDELNAGLSQLGETSTVTLPFTPTRNGLIIVSMRAVATGRCYIIFNNTRPTIADSNALAGMYCNSVISVTQGSPVSVSSTSNVQDVTYTFVGL